MLRDEKLQFQLGCEEYIEKEKLYEMFEDMMKQLIVHRPEDPVQFLIDRLQKPESKSILSTRECMITVLFFSDENRLGGTTWQQKKGDCSRT